MIKVEIFNSPTIICVITKKPMLLDDCRKCSFYEKHNSKEVICKKK